MLKGSKGDDLIATIDRRYTESEEYNVTEFIATEGNDVYIGGENIEKLTYSEIDEDELTGLYISFEEEYLPIIVIICHL